MILEWQRKLGCKMGQSQVGSLFPRNLEWNDHVFLRVVLIRWLLPNQWRLDLQTFKESDFLQKSRWQLKASSSS